MLQSVAVARTLTANLEILLTDELREVLEAKIGGLQTKPVRSGKRAGVSVRCLL